MVRTRAAGNPAAGTELERRLREEGNLALQFLLADFDNLVKQRLGFMPWEYVIHRVNRATPPVTLLSLACGAAALELHLCTNFRTAYRFDCLDGNAALLEGVRQQARRHRAALRTLRQDLDTLHLPANEYDLIIAHACLHRARRLEHIYAEVARALKPGGQFLVNDITPRNGWRLWPETAAFLEHLWSILPDRCKVDHASLAPVNGSRLWLGRLIDGDYGIYGYQCERSEEVVPLLRAAFAIDLEVPGYAFARRLLGKEFGPNYDMHHPADRATVEFMLRLDKECVAAGRLRPENVFVLASRRQDPEAHPLADLTGHPERPGPEDLPPEAPAPACRRAETQAQVDLLLEERERLHHTYEAVLRSRDEFILAQKAAYEQMILRHDLAFAAKVGRLLPLYRRLAASWPYRLALRLGLVRLGKALLRRLTR